MSAYPVKWKGQNSGPYSIDELRRKFEDREIGAMHEVFVDGNWVTLRAFFRRHPAPVVQATPPPDIQAMPQPLSPPAYREPGTLSPMPVSMAHVSPIKDIAYGHATGSDELSGRWPPDESASLVFAGFWMRVMALLIDVILLIAAPVWLLDFYLEREILTIEAIRSLPPEQWGIFAAVSLPCAWLYSAIFESSPMQATIGKCWVGLVVISTVGERISFANASLRFLAKLGSVSMCLAGFFLAAFTPRKQTFHDVMAHTVVCLRITSDGFFPAPIRTL
jgi:uncharacterized RDD family membrane protein YckC